MRLTRIMTATPAPRSRLARLATFGAALLVVPLGGLQLAACAGGGAAPSADASSATSGLAEDLSLVMTSVDGAPVAVEQVDKTLIRLTGPLRIETAEGEYLTDRADIQLASPAQDGVPLRVLRVAVLDAEVVRARYGLPNMLTDDPVPLPGRPVQTGVTIFNQCAGAIVSLPQLGRLEGDGGPCRQAGSTIPANLADNPQDQPWDVALTTVPVEGRVTNPFGRRIDPITDEPAYHSGIDMRAPEGTPIVAVADGRVTFAGWRGGYGRVVEMDHGGDVKTRYAQLSAFDVAKDDHVAAGQVIGRSGSSGRATGPHLHFELWYASEVYDPMPVFKALGLDPLTGERTSAAPAP